MAAGPPGRTAKRSHNLVQLSRGEYKRRKAECRHFLTSTDSAERARRASSALVAGLGLLSTEDLHIMHWSRWRRGHQARTTARHYRPKKSPKPLTAGVIHKRRYILEKGLLIFLLRY